MMLFIAHALKLFFNQPTAIMACRHNALVRTLAGYQQTGVPLIQFDGIQLISANNIDDIGIYILLPKLAFWLQLSITETIDLFFNGLAAIGLIIGLFGFYKLYPSWAGRFITTIAFLIVAKRTGYLTDVYRTSAALMMATVPWALYFVKKKKYTIGWHSFLLLTGIASGIAHYIRGQAGTAALLFVATLILTMPTTKKMKAYALLTLGLGLSLPIAYFQYNLHQYQQFRLQKHLPAKILEHQFWYTVYVGLGFLHNQYGITYDDTCAYNLCQKHGYMIACEPGTEQVLHGEVVKLVHKDPYFVITSIAAKLGVLLFFFLLYANIGLLADWFNPIDWHSRLAFFLALCWEALPSIIALPSGGYLFGFVTIAALYGIVAINDWLEKRRNRIQEIKRV